MDDTTDSSSEKTLGEERISLSQTGDWSYARDIDADIPEGGAFVSFDTLFSDMEPRFTAPMSENIQISAGKFIGDKGQSLLPDATDSKHAAQMASAPYRAIRRFSPITRDTRSGLPSAFDESAVFESSDSWPWGSEDFDSVRVWSGSPDRRDRSSNESIESLFEKAPRLVAPKRTAPTSSGDTMAIAGTHPMAASIAACLGRAVSKEARHSAYSAQNTRNSSVLPSRSNRVFTSANDMFGTEEDVSNSVDEQTDSESVEAYAKPQRRFQPIDKANVPAQPSIQRQNASRYRNDASESSEPNGSTSQTPLPVSVVEPLTDPATMDESVRMRKLEAKAREIAEKVGAVKKSSVIQPRASRLSSSSESVSSDNDESRSRLPKRETSSSVRSDPSKPTLEAALMQQKLKREMRTETREQIEQGRQKTLEETKAQTEDMLKRFVNS